MKRSLLALWMILAHLSTGAAGVQAGPAQQNQSGAVDRFNPQVPFFIENVGQYGPEAPRFRGGWGATALWAAEEGLWITRVDRPAGRRSDGRRPAGRQAPAWSEIGLPGTVDDSRQAAASAILVSFEGANPHPQIEPFHPLPVRVAHFTGSRTAGAVPAWAGLRYVDLYPGIDLEVEALFGSLSWRVVAHAGADIARFKPAVRGALALSRDGTAFRASTVSGELTLPAFQLSGAEISGKHPPLRAEPAGDGSFALSQPFAPAESSTFSAQSLPDGVLFSTLLAGEGEDVGQALAVADGGQVYITGYTSSNDFPQTPGALYELDGASDDAFVARFDSLSGAVDLIVVFGGSGADHPTGVAVDGQGGMYVTGYTSSTDFPILPRAFGQLDVGPLPFLVKIEADGERLGYATVFGNQTGQGTAVAVDSRGAALVAGATSDTDFPVTSGALDPTFNGGDYDVFLAQLSPDGSELAYATYLGGRGNDYPLAMRAGEQGGVYLAGSTTSGDYPTTPGAYDEALDGGGNGAFVTKITPGEAQLSFSTLLEGGADDYGFDLAVDHLGAVYLTGYTFSEDFPATPGGLNPAYQEGGDAFVAKLTPDGTELEFSTYLGGSGNEKGQAILLDAACGRAMVLGTTDSPDFPLTPDHLQVPSGGSEVFLAQIEADGSALAYATFLGGSGEDYAAGIGQADDGRSFLLGNTFSPDFPGDGAQNPAPSGGVFMAALNHPHCQSIPPIGDGAGAGSGHTIFVPLVVD